MGCTWSDKGSWGDVGCNKGWGGLKEKMGGRVSAQGWFVKGIGYVGGGGYESNGCGGCGAGEKGDQGVSQEN